MAATDTTAGLSLGSLYGAIDRLKDDANALFAMHENDVAVADLARAAMDLRVAAGRLESTLDQVTAALESLNG